ncbi:polysaccharide pyruvyl transferase family protein [Cellulomonas sp.]|uniref:polysaccharide pyruvyl transferase family protein n=1 Tax=Cellulomonas sp. TaxID=40001 RepID=UPI0028114724|nr:polysaccharide pyruvyl transferase family protein [Cellulomonas sp.]
MARIGLVGFFGWGNYGDELFLELWRQRLGRFHDVKVVHDLLHEPYFSRRAAEVAGEYDAFVIGGGDLVIPTKISSLYWNSAWLSKPVFIAGVGVPTWMKSENRDVVERMSKFFQHPNVRYIGARDDESADWIRRRLQPTVPVTSHADLVFSMDMPPARTYERPTVGLVVRQQRSGGADLSRVEAACREIAAQGYDIARIVLGNLGTGERDVEVASALDVPGEVLYSESTDEMSSNLGGLEALISMKFHGTVVATAYGVPSIVLSSTSKSQNLYRRIDRLPLLSSLTDDALLEKFAMTKLRVPQIVRDALRADALQGVRNVVDSVNGEVG